MQKKSIAYSIIIPHKNIPVLLRRCLNSIPRREDVQVIVVDDNSDSGKQPEKYSFDNQMSYEVVYTKESKGAGYARNIGMQHAIGKWLLFADADDYYNEGLLEALDAYDNSDADIIYYCVSILNNQQGEKNRNDIIYSFLNGTDNEMERRLRLGWWEPWNKMFLRSYIQSYGFQFEEIPVGNDAMFVVQAGYCARRIEASMHSLYTYTEYRHGSLSCMSYTAIRFELILRLNAFLEKEYPMFFPWLQFIKIACKEKNYNLLYTYFQLLCKYGLVWQFFILVLTKLMKNNLISRVKKGD